MQFLDTLGGRWNISLFHYRNHGADFGRVLVGFEVPDAEEGAVQRRSSRRSAIRICAERTTRRIALSDARGLRSTSARTGARSLADSSGQGL